MTRIHSQTEVRHPGLRCQVPPGQGDVEPEDAMTDDVNRRWYESTTGQVPIGWHVVAACYAATAMLRPGSSL
jgi:hypothetical protein